MENELSSSQRVQKSRYTRVRWIVLVASLVAGPVLVEVTMRFLLFHPSELAREWGAGLRDASLFADPQLEDEYWRLRWVLMEKKPTDADPHDALVGWTGPRVTPATYEHQSALPAGKRPILWYGASYASCVQETWDDCFEDLVAESDLGDEYALINYGVGGYGVGQAYLLMRESIDLHAHANPLVVFVLVVDTDFHRASLGFRTWPKPRLSSEGQLDLRAPVEASAAAYLEQNGIGISSYAWRFFLHGTEALPETWSASLRGSGESRREQSALISRILAGMQQEVAERDLEALFLLCVSPRGLRETGTEPTPMESFLTDELEKLGVPYVACRAPFIEALEGRVESEEQLFLTEGRGVNHPTREGNLVLLECLRNGIANELGR